MRVQCVTYCILTRVLIRVHSYGSPISMADYSQELFSIPPGADPNDVGYAVVHKISSRIEKELFDMTINASDW